jgi:signal transduction histidine kinase
VAAAERSRIFEAFYRSASTASSAPGLGAGLAVCKRLVEAQSGRLWVAPAEGGGSEFSFTLPLERDPVPVS